VPKIGPEILFLKKRCQKKEPIFYFLKSGAKNFSQLEWLGLIDGQKSIIAF